MQHKRASRAALPAFLELQTFTLYWPRFRIFWKL
jgi:hypothetical protein